MCKHQSISAWSSAHWFWRESTWLWHHLQAKYRGVAPETFGRLMSAPLSKRHNTVWADIIHSYIRGRENMSWISERKIKRRQEVLLQHQSKLLLSFDLFSTVARLTDSISSIITLMGLFNDNILLIRDKICHLLPSLGTSLSSSKETPKSWYKLRGIRNATRENLECCESVPRVSRSRMGDRAFSFQAPLLWNHLPVSALHI